MTTPVDTKFVKTNTPKSIAIIIIGLSIGIGALVFVPKLNEPAVVKNWVQIVLGGITIALLHAAQNAMSEQPEIDESQLSRADLLLKQRFKSLFVVLVVAYLITAFVIAAAVLDGVEKSSSWILLKWSLIVMFIIWLFGLIIQSIYRRKFVLKS